MPLNRIHLLFIFHLACTYWPTLCDAGRGDILNSRLLCHASSGRHSTLFGRFLAHSFRHWVANFLRTSISGAASSLFSASRTSGLIADFLLVVCVPPSVARALNSRAFLVWRRATITPMVSGRVFRMHHSCLSVSFQFPSPSHASGAMAMSGFHVDLVSHFSF